MSIDLNTGQNVDTEELTFKGSVGDYFRKPNLSYEEVQALVFQLGPLNPKNHTEGLPPLNRFGK